MAANVSKGIWVLTALAGLMLGLVLVNVLCSLGNQSLRLAVNEHQQVITQSIQLQELSQEIIGGIASIALTDGDEQLKSLLASQGIGFVDDPKSAGAE